MKHAFKLFICFAIIGMVVTASARQQKSISEQSNLARVKLERYIIELDGRVKSLQRAVIDGSSQSNLAIRTGAIHSSDLDRLARLQEMLDLAKKVHALSQLIDINFKNASIGRAVEMVNTVSEVKVVLDPSVPSSLIISTEANKVPLGTVLETIASTANLNLYLSRAETSEGYHAGAKRKVSKDAIELPQAIVLAKESPVMVDKKQVTLREKGRPWAGGWAKTGQVGTPISVEANLKKDYPIGLQWLEGVDYLDQQMSAFNADAVKGSNATMDLMAMGGGNLAKSTSTGRFNNLRGSGGGNSGSAGGGGTAGAVSSKAMGVGGNRTGYGAQGFAKPQTANPLGSTWLMPMITAVGKDTLVISELGTNSQMRLGLWLTVYVLRQGKLVQTSKLFHVFQSSIPTTTEAQVPRR